MRQLDQWVGGATTAFRGSTKAEGYKTSSTLMRHTRVNVWGGNHELGPTTAKWPTVSRQWNFPCALYNLNRSCLVIDLRLYTLATNGIVPNNANNANAK